MSDKKQPIEMELLHTSTFKDLTKYAQLMPKELMDKVKQKAKEDNISLEVEMASLLLTSFIEEKALGMDTLLKRFLGYKFTQQDAIAECKRRRQGWQYLFEKEKLHLFLEMKKHLPLTLRETFHLIDVEKETKRFLKKRTDS